MNSRLGAIKRRPGTWKKNVALPSVLRK